MSVSVDWSDSFFEGPWVDLHLGLRNALDIQLESRMILDVLALTPGASIVDIPCGVGDHSIALARHGHRLVGIDRSEVLIGHARERARHAGVAIEFLPGDMRTFRSQTAFDALICMWGSFGYFDAEGDSNQLETFQSLLRPGGQLLVEVLPLEGILMHFEPRNSHRVGNMTVVQERTYDVRNQRLDGAWSFHLGDGSIQRSTSLRLYTLREIFELFSSAGFEDVTTLDPETKETFALGSVRAWVCAKRP